MVVFVPFINAICSRCEAEVQMDDEGSTGFCLKCGARMKVSEAAERYRREYPDGAPDESDGAAPLPAVIDDLMLQAEAFIGQGVFEAAKSTYLSVITREPAYWAAHWGVLRCDTRNLEPVPVRHADDYAYSTAMELFEKAQTPEAEEWEAAYMEAFEQCCFLTVESVDPRVFLEVEIFRWHANSNNFLYPVSRGFDLQPVFDKVLWEKQWGPLRECIREERREEFTARGETCCKEIWDYFDTGFAHMEELKNGNFSRLMGIWELKLTTGAMKSDVLKFSANAVSIPHLETCRLKFNHYDYYRFLKMDASARILAGEHRHFPSAMGMGGDFVAHPQYEPVLGILAVYDFVLVMPTALYIRTEANHIPGYDRALMYQQKCRALPCFQRNGPRHAVQVRPIVENHDTDDPTKKVKACYIATAVYGGVDTPQVFRLRRFRDETLHKYFWGRQLSVLYYRHSPGLAERLRNKRALNRVVRGLLNAFIRILK